MICLLFCYQKNTFVPYESTVAPFITTVDERGMWQVVNQSSDVVVLVSSKKAQNHRVILDEVSRASTFYSSNIPFIHIDDSHLNTWLTRAKFTPPMLLLFSNHTLWLPVHCPSTEMPILFILESFVKKSLPVVKTPEELYSVLGHFPYSIVTSEELTIPSLNIRSEITASIGPIDVIVASEELLGTLQIKKGEIGIYRLEDQGIDSIKPNILEFYQKARPKFRAFVPSDFAHSEIYGVFIADKLTPDIEDMLFVLGERHSTFMIGYLNPRYSFIAEKATLRSRMSVDFMVFNAVLRNYFPPADLQLNTSGNVEQWFEQIDNYLTDIEAGKIGIKLHSVHNLPPLKHALEIVGENYVKTLANKSDAVVMFYTNQTFSDELKAFDEAASFFNSTHIKFVAIDIETNSAPVPFPHMPIFPLIKLFPQGNHTTSYIYPHRYDPVSIARFVEELSNTNETATVAFEPIDKEQFKIDVGNFVILFYSLSETDREPTRKYLADKWQELEIDIGLKFETTTSEQHGSEDIIEEL